MLVATAFSPSGETVALTKSVTRRRWQYSTSIVVDKSDCRLYWVKNQQLIKTYEIAQGRGNRTPVATWKILAKCKIDAKGLHGRAS